MSVEDFLSKQNVKIIWDVLIDEDILKNKSINLNRLIKIKKWKLLEQKLI